ncbi:hypothetical protein N836_28790 [Leptolyngbya sp. Heron Island J]|uniref:pentapeptide repeat-containing protein n=1 Tax=Leptolyngbya sp. Heron Island J TaxID=1385935 RepID=UPI0003B9B146|nr:pentapeptide repeat-containing protein [Leptolyngbya sp. Heron Island J]ESA39126.1 hypothetical protein N836_28790 [Leptolyngbya sp. Heron Island J]
MRRKVNQWWITITSLAALSFISAFIVIAIDSNWLGNNDWFDLEREVWSKPIWDWLELLIAPIVLAVAGFFVRQLLEKQEDDRRKHEALKDYLDDITALFLSDNWEKAVQEKLNHQEDESSRTEAGNQKVFAIAKARTLAALSELDKGRQLQLIWFLSESRELVNFTFPGRGLDLEGAILIHVNLEGADLSNVNLERALLIHPNLKGTDLRGANLEGADLGSANLEGAMLAYANLKDIKWNNEIQWDSVKGLDTAKNIPEKLKKQLKLPPYDTP